MMKLTKEEIAFLDKNTDINWRKMARIRVQWDENNSRLVQPIDKKDYICDGLYVPRHSNLFLWPNCKSYYVKDLLFDNTEQETLF